MFDNLTRAQLSQLHELLYLIGEGLFAVLFGSSLAPAQEPTSDEWQAVKAQFQANYARMGEVYAEMQRRDQASDDMADAAELSRIESSACDA